MSSGVGVTFKDIPTEPHTTTKTSDPKESRLKTYCLPFISSVLFATILEDCIQQLNILAGCNNELRIMKTVADMAILRTKKYQIVPVEDKDALDSITKEHLASDRIKLDKLYNDRQFFSDLLIRLFLEMADNGCSSSLRAAIKEIEDRRQYQADIVAEEAKNKIIRRDVVKQLRQQRNQMKSTLYDTDTLLNKLKNEVEDTAVNTEIRSRYTGYWQRARIEQHEQKIADKEAEPTFNIDYYQTRTDQEQRVHSEVELLVNICINETLNKVEEWMNKFDHDMEEQDLKIAKMKNKYQDAYTRRKELEETYADHEVLMKSWLKFKADRQDAINYREKMTKSAIIVQAWWRGLLVRLELGPYKPKKKPKAGKKEKK